MTTPRTRPDLTPPHSRRSRSAVAALALLGLLLPAYYLAGELYVLDGHLGFPLDDAWIHLAFAQRIADGHGLALQPGTPVPGSTAPLWTALVAVGLSLSVDGIVWMKLLGVLLHLATVVLTWRLAVELGVRRGLALLAAALTLATGPLLWAALSGMEVPLFLCLALAGTILHLQELRQSQRSPLSFAVLGCSVLARPEGLLLIAAAAADRLLRFRRLPEGGLGLGTRGAERPGRLPSLARGLGLAALAVVPVALFNLWAGGAPVPTTLAAKTGAGGLHLPSLQHLHTASAIFFRPHPWMLVLAPAGILTLVRRLGTERDRGLLPALWVAGLPVAYACMGSTGGGPLLGNLGRYLYPLFPFVIALGALGLEPLATAVAPGRRTDGRPSWTRRVLAALGVAVLLAPTLAGAVRTASLYARNVYDVESGDVRMARWLAARLPPEAVVATMDIGALSAILPNPILDLAGIGDPELHDYLRRARRSGRTWQDAVLQFVRDRKPDYLVVFPRWLGPVERPGSPFRRLHTVEVPGNVTLGEDTLSLYATPWTRHPLREVMEGSEDEGSP